jgi:HEAT repeat protein
MIRSLKSVKQSLLDPKDAASHAASVLVRAIEGGISSSKAAPILTELLQSSAPAVRETAASALAGMN